MTAGIATCGGETSASAAVAKTANANPANPKLTPPTKTPVLATSPSEIRRLSTCRTTAAQADQNGPDARRPQCEVSAGLRREPSGEMTEIFEPLKRRLGRRATSPPPAADGPFSSAC
jgi:hypothetical protein